MIANEPTVYLVDDDEAMCESLTCLLEAQGFRTRAHHSAEEFLDDYDGCAPGCLVLDVRMRGMNGLDLHRKLQDDGVILPVIIITGHGDIPMAVRATRAGAIDFLEKPVNDHVLVQRIRLALELDERRRREQEVVAQTVARLELLTPREREVMELVAAGMQNKQIATDLKITEKTVEAHRQRVMQKMGVSGVVDLVRQVLAVERARGRLQRN